MLNEHCVSAGTRVIWMQAYMVVCMMHVGRYMRTRGSTMNNNGQRSWKGSEPSLATKRIRWNVAPTAGGGALRPLRT